MKKKEILFTITAIFILMIITAYYVAFIKPKNINFEQPNIEIPEEDNNENIEEEPPIIEEPVIDEDTSIETSFINKYKWLGYEEVEIPNEMPEFKEILKIREMDKTNNHFPSIEKELCNLEFYGNEPYERTCVNIEVVNNKAYFVFNNIKLEIPIDNIKEAYISREGYQSTTEFALYLLTKDGDVYGIVKDEGDYFFEYQFYDMEIENIEQLNQIITKQLNKIINNVKKINNNVKYKQLIILDYGFWSYYGRAGISYDGKMYILDTEAEFNKSDFPYSQYQLLGYDIIYYLVNLNGDIILNDINTNIKFKFGINYLIFSDKDLVYIAEYNYDKEESKIKELGKLKLLYVNKKEEKIAILLDDGKTIEYSFSYEGLQNIDF